MQSRWRICRTLEEVIQVIEWCIQTGYCSFDFETKARGPHGASVDEDAKPNGPHYVEDEPTMVSIAFQPGSAYCVPLFHKESPFSRTEATSIIRLLGKKLMENIHITKIAWNLKFEMKWFLRYGFQMRGRLIDAMLLKYLLNEERPNGLKEFVVEHLPDFAGYETEVRTLFIKHQGWENIPIKKLAKYCCADSTLTFWIALYLERIVIKKKFYALFRNMCMMQTRVLAESEMMGIPIDRPYLKGIIKEQGKLIAKNLKIIQHHPKVRKFQKWRVKQKIKKLINAMNDEIDDIKQMKNKTPDQKKRLISNREQKIQRYILGELTTKKERVEAFNPNSPDQMVDILFNSPMGFEFEIVKYTKDERKQDTDRPSTDEEAMLILKKKDKSGFIERVLKQREMVKLYSTYMVAIDYHLTDKNILHGSFLITGTVTGRLSSKNPNLQNIPRGTTSSLIKKMFVPPPGHLLLEVDYGQAELRVAAEMSGDKALIEIFKRGYNVHVATGAKINGQFERYDEIKSILKDPKHPDNLYWEKQKKRGKVLNFSILYLQSDEQTADQMGCSVKEAKYFKDQWFDGFPNIQKMFDEQERFVRRHGYVVNLFGRHRRLPMIYEDSRGSQNKAIRDAINAPIQGASSDFTQLSSIVIRERIQEGDLVLTDEKQWKPQAYTVHDSMGFFIKPNLITNAVPIIEKICSDPETMKYFHFEMEKVKMKVSPEIGVTWGDLEDYDSTKDYVKLLNDKAA